MANYRKPSQIIVDVIKGIKIEFMHMNMFVNLTEYQAYPSAYCLFEVIFSPILLLLRQLENHNR